MKRDLELTGIILLSIFLLSGSMKLSADGGRYEEKNVANMTNSDMVKADIKKVQPAGYQLITANSDIGVFVYGKKNDGLPYYEKVLVKTKTAQREFNWKATQRNPNLIVADVTGTGEDSIVTIFVTSEGTGFLQSDAHVVNMALTREIPVQDPAATAKRLITSSVQGNELVFKSGGVEYRVKPGTGSGKLGSEYNSLVYGSVVNYSVEDKRLKAEITVQTANGRFLGEFILTYSYVGGRLVPSVTGFKSI